MMDLKHFIVLVSPRNYHGGLEKVCPYCPKVPRFLPAVFQEIEYSSSHCGSVEKCGTLCRYSRSVIRFPVAKIAPSATGRRPREQKSLARFLYV